MRIEAKILVTKILSIPITIKKEELGLSKKQFIQNRANARKKAREKKWEDMKATMDKLRESVLLMKNLINEAEDAEEEEDNKPWKVGRCLPVKLPASKIRCNPF